MRELLIDIAEGNTATPQTTASTAVDVRHGSLDNLPVKSVGLHGVTQIQSANTVNGVAYVLL
jgi:hypothetical protein